MFSGSMMPSVGFSRLLAMPVLACISSRSKMATPVVSLPVPAVDGDKRLELAGNGYTFADRWVYIV